MESLLGLHLDVDKLRFEPRQPRDWPSFKMHYRFRETIYHITVECNSGGRTIHSLSVDGVEQSDQVVHLVNDNIDHQVEIRLGN